MVGFRILILAKKEDDRFIHPAMKDCWEKLPVSYFFESPGGTFKDSRSRILQYTNQAFKDIAILTMNEIAEKLS